MVGNTKKGILVVRAFCCDGRRREMGDGEVQ